MCFKEGGVGVDALTELEKWCRKYYRFEITSGGNVQPGDGVQVVLMGGGRKVVVDEEDMVDHSQDEVVHPSIGEVILEAIRKWHTDDTVKKYLAYWLHLKHYPKFDPASDVEWRWWTKYHSQGMIQASFEARNDAEAIQKVKDGYKDTEFIGVVAVYERARETETSTP